MENVGGRSLVEKGALCERKNGRGVDPNRNWPVDWGKKEKDYDPSEEFPGERPLRWGPGLGRALGAGEGGVCADACLGRGEAALLGACRVGGLGG
jgi:hypothetical protein